MFTPENLNESRVLKSAFRGTAHFSRFASNGLPDEWDQSKNEFFDSTNNFSQLRPYRFLYMSQKIADSLELPEHFQSASVIVINPKTGNQLHVFDEVSGAKIDRVVEDYLAGPFRIDCL